MRFSLFAASVHGKKYRERGLPCQDYSSKLEFDSVQSIALADGHGGKDYFRSDAGAQLAVAVAFGQTKKFGKSISADEAFSESGIRNFEFSICEAWQTVVKNHWQNYPVTANDTRWENVSDKYKARYLAGEYIPVAYGTTLICAVSIGMQVLISQIGDGSCVVLQRNGEFKLPVPPDNENFANVTNSLCDADACNKFRHVVLDCSDDSPVAPVAIFLSSDGLDDCYPIYRNEQYLYKLYADAIVDSLIAEGYSLTCNALKHELLPYMSDHGSNDDISLAYMVTKDVNLLKRTLERHKENNDD